MGFIGQKGEICKVGVCALLDRVRGIREFKAGNLAFPFREAGNALCDMKASSELERLYIYGVWLGSWRHPFRQKHDQQ